MNTTDYLEHKENKLEKAAAEVRKVIKNHYLTIDELQEVFERVWYAMRSTTIVE